MHGDVRLWSPVSNGFAALSLERTPRAAGIPFGPPGKANGLRQFAAPSGIIYVPPKSSQQKGLLSRYGVWPYADICHAGPRAAAARLIQKKSSSRKSSCIFAHSGWGRRTRMSSSGGMDASSFQEEIARVFSPISVARSSPMLHDIWLRACALGPHADDRFEIIDASSGQRPIAAAAFARRAFTPSLYLVGAEVLWAQTDVHYEDEAAAAALADAVVAKGSPARFGHFPGESVFVAALEAASKGKGVVLSDALGGAPYIQFDDSWRDPEKKLKSRRRSDLRRCRKKADAIGAVTIDIIAPEPHEVDALIEEAITVEASGWKGRSKTALASDEKQLAFFRHYARLASEAGILRLAFMRIDGRPVAVQIVALCDNALWGFKSGFDEAYKAFSPGMILFLEVVRYAANAGVERHEFLGRSAPWTLEWTTDEHPRVRLRYYPFNPAGAASFLLDGFTALANRVREQIRTRFKNET